MLFFGQYIDIWIVLVKSFQMMCRMIALFQMYQKLSIQQTFS